jgi:hypothetical protein
MSGSQLAVITPVSGGNYPSQGLPGSPSHPIAPGGWPVDPGYGVPLPPVVSHPIAPGGETPSHPISGGGTGPAHPIAPPTYPVDPSYGLPMLPGVWPAPPAFPNNDLPLQPVLPTHPIYHPEAPNNELPLPPGAVWPPLPPSVTGPVLCFVWVVGVGYRWTTIDPSLKPMHPIVIPPSTVPPGAPTHPIAPGGERPSHPISGGGQEPHPDQGLPRPPPEGPPATPQGQGRR